VYFFGGWMIAQHPRAIDALRAGAWWRLSAGVFALVVSVVLAIAWFVGAGSTQPADGPVMRILLFATQSSGAVAAWLLILGGAGVAERAVRASSRPLRVLVDSSYWVYLVHLPICVLVTGLLIPWSAPGLVKMVVAITGSVLLLALGYAATLAVLPRRVRPEPCLQPEVRTLPQ
jgi:glucan biosynthesis protein C